jgi:aminopeptidase YwaD
MRRSAFSGAKAFDYLNDLTVGIGPRHGGSANEVKAAKYIRDRFGEFGLGASLFPYNIHTFADATAAVSFPGLGDVECVAVPCCQSTPQRGVRAPLVFIESGHEVYLDPSMRGKIIMTLGGFGGKNYEVLMQIKPAGVIQIGNRMFTGPFRGKAGPETARKFGTIPMVNITYEDGLRILAKAPKTCTLSVQTTGEKLGKTYNPVGELKGTQKPDEVIVIGGHFDSVWASQGCQDNAAGTVIAMELARVFAQRGSKRTLRFMAFGGEEMGLRGSIAYVKKLKEEDEKQKKDKEFVRDGLKSDLDKIIFMINIDVQGTKLGSNSFWAFGPHEIAASCKLLMCEVGPPFEILENKTYSSDNAPFGDAGIPSASFGRSGANTMFGHTSGDVIDHCDAASLALSGRFIEEWMVRHITAPRMFPFERKLPPEAEESVKKYFRGREILEWEPQMPAKRYKPKRRAGMGGNR